MGRPRHFSSPGIILKRKDYGEADRILTVYSKFYGKITLMAKGVRKPSSKKRGALEVFSFFKFSAVTGNAWDIMTEAELLDSFGNIRTDLRKASVAYFLLETIDKLAHGEEENQKLFDILVNFLGRLNNESGSLKIFREEFISKCLIEMGFWPQDELLKSHDLILEDVLERKLATVRVGKILQI